MNILIYLQPRVEFNDPYFRYPTFRNSILPQIISLQESGWNVHVIIGEGVEQLAIKDGRLREVKSYSVVSDFSLRRIIPNYRESASYWLGDEANDRINKEIEAIVLEGVPENFNPHIILSWEAPARFFKNIYPNSLLMYQWPGSLSRSPFPEMITFDNGLLSNSCQSTLIHESKEDCIVTESVREEYKDLIAEFNPLLKRCVIWKKKFKKVILIPFQVDNYFTVDNVLPEGSNQFDELLSLLQRIPNDIGVVVTQYNSSAVSSKLLNNDNVGFLKSKFENFIFENDFDSLPNISQFLCLALDGVVCISSSIGFHAALWHKPLFCLGKSHVSHLASSNTLEEYIEHVYSDYKNVQDKRIEATLRKNQVSLQYLLGQKNRLGNYFAKIYETYKNEGEDFNWPYIEKPENIVNRLKSYSRKNQYINEVKFFNSAKSNPYLGVCRELSDQIDKKNIISFDVFDTLLYRPFSSPSDIFRLMGDYVSKAIGRNVDFYSIRRKAEKIAFEKAISQGRGEVTAIEIYNEVSEILIIDKYVSEKILGHEIDLEKKFLYKRDSGWKAFQEAKSKGKKIIIISDMYHSKKVIEELLRLNGFEGYSKLYVSSELSEKKHSGRIYDIVLKDLGVNASDILHVGDNLRADIIKAKDKGLKPFHLNKAVDEFKKTRFYNDVWLRDESRHNLSIRTLLSIQANKFKSNPYQPERKGSWFGGDRANFGYLAFGPLLLGFSKWIIESAINDGYKEVYFLARDGKIVKETYDVISKAYPLAPPSKYLLCSRRAVNLAKVKNFDDILDLLNVDFAKCKLGFLLENRFGLRSDQVGSDILNKNGFNWMSTVVMEDRERITYLLNDIRDIIFSVAKYERENYLGYLNEQGFINKDKKLIVDIGYAGTMQESLSSLSNKTNINGLYLITFRNAIERVRNKKMKANGYLAEYIDRHDTFHPFCSFVPMYESLFSSEETSFVRFEKTSSRGFVPIFMAPSKSESERLEFVRDVQSGAISYCKDIVKVLKDYFPSIDIEPFKSLRVLDSFFRNPLPIDAKMFSGLTFEDAYGGGGDKIILPKIEDANNRGNYVWKNGLSAILSASNQGCSNLNKELNYSIKVRPLFIKLANKFLTKRKFDKLHRNPEGFFNDSNRLLSRIIKPIVITT